MNLYVYPTDQKWFHFLKDRQPHDEINFWQPGGGTQFTRLALGELFLFRLKSPENRIAGGGIFLHSTLLPITTAWDTFGTGNGVASFGELFDAIKKYRSKNSSAITTEDTLIGCIALQFPFFCDPYGSHVVPKDYSLNLVQGKRYSTDEETGRTLFQWAMGRYQSATPGKEVPILKPMFGNPTKIRPRLGQAGFRLLVTDAYDKRCAVTGERTLPVLEAAHIRPVASGGHHETNNGLLLRSDVHKLFDLGYVTVTPEGEFRVSAQLKETWENGKVYYALDRTPIRMPRGEEQRPSGEFLQWHNDTVFRD